MQVPLRCSYIKMTKQVFYVPYICSLFQQVGGKAVSQAVYAHIFLYASLIFCSRKNLLYCTHRVSRIRLV